MDKSYIIFQENGLFGVKNRIGKVVIQPQYLEMQPFNCGLSLVKNQQYGRTRQTLWGGRTDANPKLSLNDT